MGELLAWMVGWALILEYAVAASAVSVGWSGYFVGLLSSSLGIVVPPALASGPYAGGVVNLPALIIALLVTWLLMKGTKQSDRLTAVMVAVKITSLTLFNALTSPMINRTNFVHFLPTCLRAVDVIAASPSTLFSYVGFALVSTQRKSG